MTCTLTTTSSRSRENRVEPRHVADLIDELMQEYTA